MSGFSLRPVHDMSPSPSPTASTTSPDDHPAYKVPAPVPSRPSPPTTANGRPRRPFSPSSLRGDYMRAYTRVQRHSRCADLDLSQSNDGQPRKYPAPPTGHDLMAMFPPAPPDNFPEMRPGPTSGFFQRQERAFFAQAGKEIVRVRLEVDLPHGPGSDSSEAGKSSSLSRASSSSSRPWPPAASSSSHGPPPISGSTSHSPSISSSTAPPPYPHPASHRTSPRGSLSNAAAHFPISPGHSHPHPHSQGPPPNLHPPPGQMHQHGPGVRTPPQDPSQLASGAKPEYPQEDYDDESWKRPMPYAERRRAGKHTRRVIVRT